MKAFLLLPLLFVAGPAEAHRYWDGFRADSSMLKRHWKVWADHRRHYRVPPRRVIGRQGDCPSERDGYCRSVHDWWDYQNNRN